MIGDKLKYCAQQWYCYSNSGGLFEKDMCASSRNNTRVFISCSRVNLPHPLLALVHSISLAWLTEREIDGPLQSSSRTLDTIEDSIHKQLRIP